MDCDCDELEANESEEREKGKGGRTMRKVENKPDFLEVLILHVDEDNHVNTKFGKHS